MRNVIKAVIPASGRGTRMRPLTEYLPKPMLPLGKKPVLQHIVEELKEADIREMAIVIHPDHESVYSYFNNYPGITFIRDDSRSGPGGALLKAEKFIGGDPFITLFSDAPVKGSGREEHLKELIEIKKSRNAGAALSIYQIPQTEISSRGVVVPRTEKFSKAVRLADIIEKPPPAEKTEGKQWASACRFVLDARIFKALKNIERDEDGEIQLTPAIRRLIKKVIPVMGVPLKKELVRYDTGNFSGYFEAFEEFADRKQS